MLHGRANRKSRFYWRNRAINPSIFGRLQGCVSFKSLHNIKPCFLSPVVSPEFLRHHTSYLFYESAFPKHTERFPSIVFPTQYRYLTISPKGVEFFSSTEQTHLLLKLLGYEKFNPQQGQAF